MSINKILKNNNKIIKKDDVKNKSIVISNLTSKCGLKLSNNEFGPEHVYSRS